MKKISRNSLLSYAVDAGPTEGQGVTDVFNRIKNGLIVAGKSNYFYNPYPFSSFKNYESAMAGLKKILPSGNCFDERYFAWDEAFLKMSPNQVWVSSQDTLVCVENHLANSTGDFSGHNVYAISNNASKVKAIESWFEAHAKPQASEKVESGTVFLLAKNGGSLIFISAGRKIKSDLLDTNYSKEVVNQHRYVLTNIASKSPPGRIVIYQGDPGTGKTYLVRNLISKLSNVNTILIQSNQVKEIGTPNFIPALMHLTYNSFPVVFIIEDADEILSRRKAENMSGISTLLNVGDGVLGTVFDTRVVCTTNTKIKEFDPAIMRPGRLMSLIDVGGLSKSEAKVCGAEILKKEKISKNVDFTSCKTLAEIYAKVGSEKRALINMKAK